MDTFIEAVAEMVYREFVEAYGPPQTFADFMNEGVIISFPYIEESMYAYGEICCGQANGMLYPAPNPANEHCEYWTRIVNDTTWAFGLAKTEVMIHLLGRMTYHVRINHYPKE